MNKAFIKDLAFQAHELYVHENEEPMDGDMAKQAVNVFKDELNKLSGNK